MVIKTVSNVNKTMKRKKAITVDRTSTCIFFLDSLIYINPGDDQGRGRKAIVTHIHGMLYSVCVLSLLTVKSKYRGFLPVVRR